MKGYLKYLIGKLKDALCLVWEKLGLLGTLVTILPSIITKIISTPQPITFKKIFGGNWKLSIYIFLIIIVLVYLYYLFVVFYVKHNENEKLLNNLQDKNNPDWQNIEFFEWNKRFSENQVKGGIIIENNKRESINKCWVQIVEIYGEDGGGFFKGIQSGLPRTAGWEIDGNVIYDKTEIENGKKGYLALVFCKNLFGLLNVFLIGAKNDFTFCVDSVMTRYVEIEISGIVGGFPLKPKTKFVKVYFDGKKFTIMDVKNNPPNKQV